MIHYRGCTLTYERLKGNKPICICLHGMNMDRTMYQSESLCNLLSHYTLVLVDICGYGDSQINTKTFDMSVMNELLLLLMKKENIKACCLCGYCLGGVFALDFTIRNPHLVQHLILIETMIYLPQWLWLTAIPGYQQAYQYFHENELILNLIERIPMFSRLKYSTNHHYFQQCWHQDINTFYLKMMNQYQKQNHCLRSQNIQCFVDIIYSMNSFLKVKRTAKDLSVYQFVRIHEVQSQSHFVFVDPALKQVKIS